MGNNTDDVDATDSQCSGTETRCAGSSFQTCTDGMFVTGEVCAGVCSDDAGCLDCDPSSTVACDGNNAVTCTADGQFGEVLETCGDGEECSVGECIRSCTADGVDLVYVVDDSYNLRSFDPRLVGTGNDPFVLIGPLACPASNTPAPGWTGTITPFSMAVDREAVAWVLYASGEIFKVSTADATCENSGFTPVQQGMNLFGMGFVTDSPGADTEKLFIGGGSASATPGGQLAVVDNDTLAVSLIGPMRSDTEYSAELTGTGNAEIFGFYPGVSSAFVQEIDRNTGAGTGPEYSLPGGLGGTVRAWAFAQWGGKFYLFVTTAVGGGFNSTVRTIDRDTGTATTIIEDLPYYIVGAGVSTCAPTTVD